jgi:hypothetical protein
MASHVDHVEQIDLNEVAPFVVRIKCHSMDLMQNQGTFAKFVPKPLSHMDVS